MLGEHNYKCLISDSSQNISLEISNDTKTLWTEKGQINSITRENLEHFSSFKLINASGCVFIAGASHDLKRQFIGPVNVKQKTSICTCVSYAGKTSIYLLFATNSTSTISFHINHLFSPTLVGKLLLSIKRKIASPVDPMYLPTFWQAVQTKLAIKIIWFIFLINPYLRVQSRIT